MIDVSGVHGNAMGSSRVRSRSRFQRRRRLARSGRPFTERFFLRILESVPPNHDLLHFLPLPLRDKVGNDCFTAVRRFRQSV